MIYLVFFSLEFYSVSKKEGHNFNMIIATGLAYFAGNFGPSFYYLYVHHRIFKETQEGIDNAHFSGNIVKNYESFIHLNQFEELS